MPIETEKRLIDANLNRLREGIRVLEDIARYILNDLPLSSALKELRHKARVANSTKLLQYRDVKNDILKTSIPSEKRRENLRDIVVANFKRSEESARVLEEIFKLDSVANLAFKMGNLPLELHSADFANLGRFADLSPVSHPKSAKNHESQIENLSVANSTQSVEFNEKIKTKKPLKSFCYFWLKPKVEFPLPLKNSNLLVARNGSGARDTAILQKKSSEIDKTNGERDSESNAICEIFKAIRYKLYDIEIAYFKAMDRIGQLQ